MSALLLVAVGAVVGALGRFAAETLMQRDGEGFPWGTFAVNVVGSLILGITLAAQREQMVSANVLLLVGTGFCGALTTFSGFAYRIEAELRRRQWWLAASYALGSLAVGIGAAALGYGLIVNR
jgi:CrcB protein